MQKCKIISSLVYFSSESLFVNVSITKHRLKSLIILKYQSLANVRQLQMEVILSSNFSNEKLLHWVLRLILTLKGVLAFQSRSFNLRVVCTFPSPIILVLKYSFCKKEQLSPLKQQKNSLEKRKVLNHRNRFLQSKTNKNNNKLYVPFLRT